MSEPTPVLLWFRRDLRLRDHAALLAACTDGPVIPIYILDDETPKHRHMGGASRWWLHHSLSALDDSLRARGSRLILRRGRSAEVLADIAAQTGASRVHCLRHYEPWWRNAERAVVQTLSLVRHDGNYLLPPGTLSTGAGEPYRIFTPFQRALWQHMPPAEPVAAPSVVPAPTYWPDSDYLSHWALLPHAPDWAAGFRTEWQPGENGAQLQLQRFAENADRYEDNRNFPSIDGTSRLSPHLHFGEVSPAILWHRIAGAGLALGPGRASFLRELAWRDYAQNVVMTFPDYGARNGKALFDTMSWRESPAADGDIERWRRGQTGYPIVDAGMRQLWHTGWMHNRVRMIAASFLVKHLLVDWRVGEQWFWDTLVDADYAQNSVNWQWVAGSGVDANMFGRIMAPLVQSPKFDAGAYIRHWVPELAHVPDGVIHDPDGAGCRPSGYPGPIIAHRAARERALAAYEQAKARAASPMA